VGMIRRAEERDVPSLAELMSQLGYPTTAREMSDRLRAISCDQSFATFVAVEGDDILGMIGISISLSYEHNDRTGRIVALVVAEKMRRRGIGRDLIEAAENYFRRQKILRIVLNTRFEREAAHGFYQTLGYVRTGFRFAKQLR
jgi:ribosomal protein S18 acetylase RimI-like enzyme